MQPYEIRSQCKAAIKIVNEQKNRKAENPDRYMTKQRLTTQEQTAKEFLYCTEAAALSTCQEEQRAQRPSEVFAYA